MGGGRTHTADTLRLGDGQQQNQCLYMCTDVAIPAAGIYCDYLGL